MKRKCELIASSNDGKKAIYVDSNNKQEILDYLNRSERHKKKFRFITSIILEGLRNAQIYDKEEVNSGCKGVTAMKFFKGQENDRIYCKEVTNSKGTFIVVASVLHEKKKTKKLSHLELSLIEKVASYDYEI